MGEVLTKIIIDMKYTSKLLKKI